MQNILKTKVEQLRNNASDIQFKDVESNGLFVNSDDEFSGINITILHDSQICLEDHCLASLGFPN